MNDFPKELSSTREKKLTTKALEELSTGSIEYRVIPRRRSE
jgi:DNA-directed RNA polymerase subunit K/omega